MGSRTKLLFNTWLGFEIEAAAEVAALAARFGVSPHLLEEVAAENPVVSPAALAKLVKMQARDDRPDFSLAWALKDLKLTRRAAGPTPAPVAAAIADRWQSLVDQGWGDLDVSAARHGLGSSQPSKAPGAAEAARRVAS